ncbi:MAG TPA: DUF4902 domain-containing protein [Gammaproteobacteria bacterium]|nr:DUF4902 domain-containing protein [Gammaproteobacteria bacterium]
MKQHTTSPGPAGPATGVALAVSHDGYIRLSFRELQTVPLVHLISGLDDDAPVSGFNGAMPTDIAGYTEWVSLQQPAVTLGWDWQLHCTPAGTRLRRTGEPRSNLMLQDASGTDIGYRQTTLQLEVFIAVLGWQETVERHISHRYRR